MKFLKIGMYLILMSQLIACSASYKELSKLQDIKPNTFQDYLLNEYKSKAVFEAEEMHDWNSAKLYSEKALKSLNTDVVYPEKISYWKLPPESIDDIENAYDSLMLIYDNAKIIDPNNLAKAIVSLDCWSEQQEENWQTWDINKCKDDFFNSMHVVYNKLSKESGNDEINIKLEKKNEHNALKKNNKSELIEVIYFDFDKTKLSKTSIQKIKKFLRSYKNEINEYLVIGHTDTKGTRIYNLNLSLERAEVIKKLLVENGIESSQINILGRGEDLLAVKTPDDTKHPANRRVEIKKSN